MNQADGRGCGRGRQATESLPNEPGFPLRDEGRWGNRRWFSPNMPERIDVTVLNLTCWGGLLLARRWVIRCFKSLGRISSTRLTSSAADVSRAGANSNRAVREGLNFARSSRLMYFCV